MPGTVKRLPPGEFLKQAALMPVIDVRSPSEYNQGHIPGAVNIPLFDDNQRAEVGTLYKRDGRLKAVLSAIDLTAPAMSSKLREAIKYSVDGRLLIYCWRGGMRSDAMAWLFSLGELDSLVLDGGYKSYRTFILDDLGRERRFMILGGMTGSGKTQILRHMSGEGLQVTDLEALASHRGSAFGALGQPPQPSSEYFANLLYADLSAKKQTETIWLEDESKNIGTVFMPDSFYGMMQVAPVIVLRMNIETRLPRLTEEYAAFPPGMILDSIEKISRRLGGDRAKAAAEAVSRRNFADAIRITLEYYDKAYNYSLSKRQATTVTFVDTDTDDVVVNTALIMEAAGINRH